MSPRPHSWKLGRDIRMNTTGMLQCGLSFTCCIDQSGLSKRAYRIALSHRRLQGRHRSHLYILVNATPIAMKMW